MDLFITSYLPSSSYINLTSLASLLSSTQLDDGDSHGDFIRLLQYAQKLKVQILPLVWEPRLEKLGLEGATGRVDQRTWNSRRQFAFKRFRPDPTAIGLTETKFRKLQYNAMINEITILSCPAIADHHSIADLFGIGFEVVLSTGQIWPTLIFYKANSGDLIAFLSEKQNIQEDTLLNVCYGVAEGLLALHSCGVVHGDLKPGNILLWEKTEPEPHISLQLTDFGFSAFATSEDALVRVSRSEPWEAPEWHMRDFTLVNAKKTDMYSFGLLCFWVFFRDQCLAEFGRPSTTVHSAFLGIDPEATTIMQALKRNGDSLLFWALKLLREREDLADRIRSKLEQVFRWTLVNNREERYVSIEAVVRFLSDTNNLQGQLRSAKVSSVTAPDWHGVLDLGRLVLDLEACDYRVHSFLANRLQEMANTVGCRSCMKNSAFQLALCYSFGFGVARNEEECALWLVRSGKGNDDLTATLDQIKSTRPRTRLMGRLATLGYRNDLSERYSRDGILEAAIKEYHSMVLARSEAFGPAHSSTLRLKSILIKLLRWNDEYRDALNLALEILESPGLEASDCQDLKYTLSLIYMGLGDIAKAEEIGKELLQAPPGEGQATTERLDYRSHLVDILIHKNQFEDAIHMGKEVAQDCVRELGSNHAISLAANRNLAEAYIGAGNVVQALDTTKELARVQEHATTLQDPRPTLVQDISLLGVLYFRARDNERALTCYNTIQGWISRNRGVAKYATITVNNHATGLIKRGALEEAAVILEALLQECNKSLGPDSEESALVMGNLCAVLHSQGGWEKMELLGKQVVEIWRRTLGPSHPNTIVAMGNYRVALLAQKKVDSAIELAKQEVQCVKDAAGATNESIIYALLAIANNLESAGAFAEAMPFLEEASRLENAEAPKAQQRVLSITILEATCYLQLYQRCKARDAIFRLLTSLDGTTGVEPNSLISRLLRLTEVCLEKGCDIEAEQILVGAIVLSRSSPNASDETRAKADATLRRYAQGKDADSLKLTFNPSVLRRGPREN